MIITMERLLTPKEEFQSSKRVVVVVAVVAGGCRGIN